ncbi:unnamed protein product [Amoebophrya sp. A120]|nr:unnamed protein product [Amoebophrya sp. A120]|eukprot:GSA120T00007625001.1
MLNFLQTYDCDGSSTSDHRRHGSCSTYLSGYVTPFEQMESLIFPPDNNHNPNTGTSPSGFIAPLPVGALATPSGDGTNCEFPPTHGLTQGLISEYRVAQSDAEEGGGRTSIHIVPESEVLVEPQEPHQVSNLMEGEHATSAPSTATLRDPAVEAARHDLQHDPRVGDAHVQASRRNKTLARHESEESSFAEHLPGAKAVNSGVKNYFSFLNSFHKRKPSPVETDDPQWKHLLQVPIKPATGAAGGSKQKGNGIKSRGDTSASSSSRNGSCSSSSSVSISNQEDSSCSVDESCALSSGAILEDAPAGLVLQPSSRDESELGSSKTTGTAHGKSASSTTEGKLSGATSLSVEAGSRKSSPSVEEFISLNAMRQHCKARGPLPHTDPSKGQYVHAAVKRSATTAEPSSTAPSTTSSRSQSKKQKEKFSKHQSKSFSLSTSSSGFASPASSQAGSTAYVNAKSSLDTLTQALSLIAETKKGITNLLEVEEESCDSGCPTPMSAVSARTGVRQDNCCSGGLYKSNPVSSSSTGWSKNLQQQPGAPSSSSCSTPCSASCSGAGRRATTEEAKRSHGTSTGNTTSSSTSLSSSAVSDVRSVSILSDVDKSRVTSTTASTTSSTSRHRLKVGSSSMVEDFDTCTPRAAGDEVLLYPATTGGRNSISNSTTSTSKDEFFEQVDKNFPRTKQSKLQQLQRFQTCEELLAPPRHGQVDEREQEQCTTAASSIALARSSARVLPLGPPSGWFSGGRSTKIPGNIQSVAQEADQQLEDCRIRHSTTYLPFDAAARMSSLSGRSSDSASKVVPEADETCEFFEAESESDTSPKSGTKSGGLEQRERQRSVEIKGLTSKERRATAFSFATAASTLTFPVGLMRATARVCVFGPVAYYGLQMFLTMLVDSEFEDGHAGDIL